MVTKSGFVHICIFLILSMVSHANQERLSISGVMYKYEEEFNGSFFMDLKSSDLMFNIDYEMLRKLKNDTFLNTRVGVTSGKVDYTSEGTGFSKGEDNNIYYMEPVIKRCYKKGSCLFLGAGFRVLENIPKDLYSSTGHVNYKRVNTLLYIPLGIDYVLGEIGWLGNIHISAQIRAVIEGQQKSMIPWGTLTHYQRSGLGSELKLRVPFKNSPFYLGAYYSSWDIPDSDINADGSMEPHNFTDESGLTLGYIIDK